MRPLTTVSAGLAGSTSSFRFLPFSQLSLWCSACRRRRGRRIVMRSGEELVVLTDEAVVAFGVQPGRAGSMRFISVQQQSLDRIDDSIASHNACATWGAV